MTSPRYEPGHMLADRFRIVCRLGHGAVGEVYLAEHQVLMRRYAVKILKRKFQKDEVVSKRFQREALAASRLEHPNIVYISDFGRTEDGTPYLAMEYIQGMSLASAIANALPRVLPLHRALAILAQVAHAVATAHDSGVLHRDLKPENIMLRQERSGGEQVKILDFGLAKITVDIDPDATALTQKGVMFGTPAYMSPEQARGEPVDTRADIYAFGAIAFELFTGEPPFNGPSLGNLLLAKQTMDPPPVSEKRPRGFQPLPAELEALVTRCLRRPKDERPLRMSEAAQVLEACYEEVSAVDSRDSASKVTTLEFERLDADSLVEPETVSVPDDLTGAKGDAAPRSEPVSETLPVPDSLTDTRPKGATSSVGSETSFVEIAPYKWRQVVAEALTLAKLMKKKAQTGPSAEVEAILDELDARKKRIRELRRKLSEPMSRLRELETQTREKTAQLRHRLIDLRLAQTEENEKVTPDPRRLKTLDEGIAQQERVMAEVYREGRQAMDQPRQEVVALEAEIEKIQRTGLETEFHLLEVLRKEVPMQFEDANSANNDEGAGEDERAPSSEMAASYRRMMRLLEG